MTIFHFGNCLALAYAPYHLTYKCSGLSEYGAFWKCVTAGAIYMITQLAKMIFLATVFPVPLDEDDDDPNAEIPFDFLMEFWKLTVDLADLIGLYFVIQRVAGKGQVKVLTAGLGWAFAELVLTRVIFLWVGARGIEFDWKYIQNSFEANISLLHHITLAALVWLWTRREIQKSVVPVLLIVGLVCSYKGLILDLLVHNFALGTWTALVYKAVSTFGLSLVTLQMYVGMTSLTDKY